MKALSQASPPAELLRMTWRPFLQMQRGRPSTIVRTRKAQSLSRAVDCQHRSPPQSRRKAKGFRLRAPLHRTAVRAVVCMTDQIMSAQLSRWCQHRRAVLQQQQQQTLLHTPCLRRTHIELKHVQSMSRLTAWRGKSNPSQSETHRLQRLMKEGGLSTARQQSSLMRQVVWWIAGAPA